MERSNGRTRANRVAKASARFGGALALLSGAAWIAVGLAAPSAAVAGTTPVGQPYELYCPGTPVGNVILNGAVTTGTISPASPAAGGQFNVTGYQTVVNVPASLVSASAALGNTDLAGSATTTVNATGATPAMISPPSISFTSPIPSPVPTTGLTLDLPSPAGMVGPFTASGGPIEVTEASAAKLTLTVSGSPLALTCTSYTNNAAPEGITSTVPPTSDATSPIIAMATAGGSPTPTTVAPTPTPTSPPATTPPTSGLAYTGAGPGLFFLALMGIVLLVGASMLLLFDRTRKVAVRLLHRVESSPPS